MELGRLDLLCVQVGAGISQQLYLVAQTGVGGQKQRRPSGPIPQVHGGSFEKEISQNRQIGSRRCEMLSPSLSVPTAKVLDLHG